MAFIDYVAPEEIPEQDRVADRDNIIRIHSLNPRSMRDHHQLYAHLMRGPSPLSRVQREMIAVTVSAANHCFY